ncbi:MAG: MFS transporter, partial [Chloroflexota bacterium]
MESEFQLGRAATSGVYSAYMAVSALVGIAAGMAVDRWGPRRTLVVMALVTGLSLALVARMDAFWQLYITYGFLMALGSGGAYTVLLSATSRWFVRHRGLALSMAGSGAAVGAIVMAPVAAYLIGNLGWRMSYLAMGVVAMVGVSGLSFVFK